MPFTPAQQQRVIDAIRARTQGRGVCEACSTNAWILVGGVLDLEIDKNVLQVGAGVQRLPLVAMTCSNCGNTRIHNLVILGLDDIALEVFRGG